MRRFFPFAALLGVAFVLGCQDVGTGVVASDGPGPQFAKPNCDVDDSHPSCKDEEPPTGDGPYIAVCCSQKEFGRNPAKQIAGLLGGTYRTLKAKQFNEMLIADLAEIDVLIFYWKTSDNVNADWATRLEPMMRGGGGIIYEDPTNLGDLAAGVSILGVQGHATERNPITVTIEHASGLTGLTTAPNAFTGDVGTDADLTFINNHIIFGTSAGLTSFLTLTDNTDTWPNGNDAVVGLAGQFGSGRIVLTGLDNDYHGGGNDGDQQQNHYDLLFNEICWVMGDVLSGLEPLCQNEN